MNKTDTLLSLENNNKNTLNPKNVVRTESKKLTTAKDTGISYFSN